MKTIVFITPRDAEYGFMLAGVKHIVISEEETGGALEKVLSETDNGVVVLDERLTRGVSEKRLREMERKWYGILLILPAPEKSGGTLEDYVQKLIRRAIGYHVRLGI